MAIEIWLAFVAAACVLLIIPGPTITLVISYAISHGARAGLHVVAGVALGDLTAMTLSLLGVGAILSASASLFAIVKWAGAAYLIYLGIKLMRAPVGDRPAQDEAARRPWRIFAHAYAVTALNPKSIVFFVAFVPQFMDAAAPLPPQMIILTATFVSLAAINAAGYALLAGRASQAIRRPPIRRWVNRLGGGALIGAGILAAVTRRAS